MKKLLTLGLCLGILVSCKDEKIENTTDPVLEMTNDTISKDTITGAEQVNGTNDRNTVIEVTSPENKVVEVQYATFGDKINADKALTKDQMLKKYSTMKKGDTLALKFKSTITEVCKKKGCWMKMDLAGKESFVRFKDYGFFVPLNADNSEAVVSGRAYIDVISIDELKHYAKDGGKSEEEIEKITAPKITYAFQADGVLIQK